MDLEILTRFLMWCTIINGGLLVFWTLALISMQGFVYRLHGKLFAMPRETFNAVIYGFLGFFKGAWILLNLVPWVVLAWCV